MKYQLDLHGGIGRYVEELTPEARKALDTAIRTTIHYIFGIRDGSAYRYEDQIQLAADAVYRARYPSRYSNENRNAT